MREEGFTSTAVGNVFLANSAELMKEIRPRNSKYKSANLDMPQPGTPEDYLEWANEALNLVPAKYRSVAVIEISGDYDGPYATVSWKEA